MNRERVVSCAHTPLIRSQSHIQFSLKCNQFRFVGVCLKPIHTAHYIVFRAVFLKYTIYLFCLCSFLSLSARACECVIVCISAGKRQILYRAIRQ